MLIRGEPVLPATVEELLPARLLAQLDRLDVASRNVFSGKLAGERRSKRRGRSVEFDDYRDYAPGDDPRFIDWNALARLDRLVVKLFLEEQDLAVHLLLDASASMRDAGGAGGLGGSESVGETPSKVVYAQRLVFAIAYIALNKQNRVSVSVATKSGEVRHLGEMRGRRNIPRAGRFLVETVREEETGARSASRAPRSGEEETLPYPSHRWEGFRQTLTPPAPPGGGGATVNDALREFARTRRGAGVSVVVSDFLAPEGVDEGLRALASGQRGSAAGSFDCFAVQVLSPGELDPAREASASGSARGGGLLGDLRLVDVESGAGVEATVSAALLKRYRENLERYLAGISSTCAARNIAHVLLRTDTPLEDALLRTLRQRGLVR